MAVIIRERTINGKWDPDRYNDIEKPLKYKKPVRKKPDIRIEAQVQPELDKGDKSGRSTTNQK